MRKKTRTRPTVVKQVQPAATVPVYARSEKNQVIHEAGEAADSAPYDENLLEHTRTQWQFGDWARLAKLGYNTLQHHPDRAKLALLASAGYLQQGDSTSARQFIRLAQDWGCSKKLVGQVLIAGVHNSLGRAAAIMGDELRALKHFETAIAIGTPSSEMRLITQARVAQQFAQLGLPISGTLQQSLTNLASSTQKKPPPTLSHHHPINVRHLASHNLGNALPTNSASFRHHGILTSGEHQFTAFYVDDCTLRLVQRHLPTEILQTHDLIGQHPLPGTDKNLSLGIDRAGYLHIIYGHRAQLHYRRSTAPHNIQGWTDGIGMTGLDENKVSHPCFIVSASTDSPFMLLYRDGQGDAGSVRIKTYDEASQSWCDRATPIPPCTEQKPRVGNAYWSNPATGIDGSLHLSSVWRTHSVGGEGRINLCHAHSRDNGLTWITSHNLPPMTAADTETADPVPLDGNLINQISMALDSHDRPHIVFYSDDPNGIAQYQHLWFDGTIWQDHYLSQRKTAVALTGGDGALQTSIGRPEIVIDRQDNVYIIYRGDLTDNRMAVTCLPAPYYTDNPLQTSIVLDTNPGHAQPVIDRTRWQNENVLTLLIQSTQQLHDDIQYDLQDMPISLVDLCFLKM